MINDKNAPQRFRYCHHVPTGREPTWHYGVCIKNAWISSTRTWIWYIYGTEFEMGFDSDPWESLSLALGMNVERFEWLENPNGWHGDLVPDELREAKD